MIYKISLVFLICFVFTTKVNAAKEKSEKWILTEDMGPDDCPGYVNGSECQLACFHAVSDFKVKRCMKANVKKGQGEAFRAALAKTEVMLKTVEYFDLPAEGSNFYTFSNALLSNPEACKESTAFLETLRKAQRNCSSGGSGGGSSGSR